MTPYLDNVWSSVAYRSEVEYPLMKGITINYYTFSRPALSFNPGVLIRLQQLR